MLNMSFPQLQDFCSGLATAFPSTATVQSNFVIIGWNKIESRFDFTDFFLEGIFHSKQLSQLRAISLLL